MNTELEIAKENLFGANGLQVSNIGVFPGNKPGLTVEEIAGEINRVLEMIVAGDFEEVVL